MAPLALHRLWDRAPFTVDLVDGKGDDLVIAFSSIGHDPSRPPSPEFLATATGRGTRAWPRRALFVSDAGRGWASDPGFGPALLSSVAALRDRAPIARIATIGLSMGAFSALAAMQILPVDVALAFGPQFSVLPGLGPDDSRWQAWTTRLAHNANPPFPVAPLPGAGQGWACLFHGLADDHAQAMAFPLAAHTDHLLFPDQSHASLVPHLKAKAGLSGLMEAALTGDRRRLLRLAIAAGGQRRRA